MSITRSINLWCDHAECTDAFNAAAVSPHMTVRELRAEAKQEGWTHRNGRDYCPDHKSRRGGVA